MPYFRSISPEEHFEENNVLKKNLLFFFQMLSEKRLEVAQKILAAFSKLKITYPGD